MQRLTITLPEDDARALREQAARDGQRGMSSILRAALAEQLPLIRITGIASLRKREGKTKAMTITTARGHAVKGAGEQARVRVPSRAQAGSSPASLSAPPMSPHADPRTTRPTRGTS